MKSITPKYPEKLENFLSTYEPCQKIRTASKRYRVTMGAENTRFNAKVNLDFMCIEGTSVLHMFDDATHFSAAQFIEPPTTESVWETILTLWATVHTGLSNTVVFDDGSQFRDSSVEICDIHDAEWQRSGTQHHSALRIGE